MDLGGFDLITHISKLNQIIDHNQYKKMFTNIALFKNILVKLLAACLCQRYFDTDLTFCVQEEAQD